MLRVFDDLLWAARTAGIARLKSTHARLNEKIDATQGTHRPIFSPLAAAAQSASTTIISPAPHIPPAMKVATYITPVSSAQY